MVDDHKLFREKFLDLIKSFSSKYAFNIVFTADNGLDMIQTIDPENLPSLIVMDISNEQKDAYQSVVWLKTRHPDIRIVVLSLVDSNDSIAKMFRLGANAYVLKTGDIEEFIAVIESVIQYGAYVPDPISRIRFQNIRFPKR